MEYAMLAFFGFCIIVALLASILFKKLSVLVALILLPSFGALCAGFSPGEVSTFITGGLRSVAPVVAMLVFAVFFFGTLSDAGMLDPIISRIVKKMGDNPVRITMGTALLTFLIHLDGSGAVAFMLVIPALLPLYEHLGMDRRVLAGVAALTAGANILPWIAPVVRASAVLEVTSIEIFYPLIPVQIVSLGLAFYAAYVLGKKEAKRLGLDYHGKGSGTHSYAISAEQQVLRRPKLFWVNIALALVVLASLVSGLVDASVAFMIGTATALCLNYPDVAMQKQRLDAHARTALMIGSLLLSAGVFVGIMRESGMLHAMAIAVVETIPAGMERHIPLALGLVSVPLSLVFDPDSYYFGVMPIIAEVYRNLGGDPITIARASLLGVHTLGFPVSPMTPTTFVLIGLARLDLAEHQRFTIPLMLICCLARVVTALIFGVIPL